MTKSESSEIGNLRQNVGNLEGRFTQFNDSYNQNTTLFIKELENIKELIKTEQEKDSNQFVELKEMLMNHNERISRLDKFKKSALRIMGGLGTAAGIALGFVVNWITEHWDKLFSK
jgi:septation ring formation regulator EzrA